MSINNSIFNVKTKKIKTVLEEKVECKDKIIQNEFNKKQERINQLSQDIIQSIAGEIVPNIEERKQEFIQLHNEIRVMQGKEPRELRQ